MSDSKKRLLIISGGIVGLVILIVIILLLINSFTKVKGYGAIEKKVLNAATDYYNDHKEMKPNKDKLTVTITDSELTSAGYLKSLTKLTSKLTTNTCSATVYVTYNLNTKNYRYTPILDCGDSYKTETLTSHIKKVENIVYNGDGLYEMNNELVFRGESPKNFVELSGKLWRIVKIEDGKVVLLLRETIEDNYWDDRYNNEQTSNVGINDYNVSRIKSRLDWLYQNNKIVKNEYKNLLAIHNLYIGKRMKTDFNNDGSIEKANYIENEYVGLLPLYDYINASTDQYCNSVKTANCSNYNYMIKKVDSWWTMTANSYNTYRVYSVDGGVINSTNASNTEGIRPVVYLVEDAIYTGGEGTSSNPYTIK